MDRDHASRRAAALLDIVPGLRRTLRELARIEVLDRALVIAAQCLFSVAPLLIVVSAFGPDTFSEEFADRVGDVLGINASRTAGLEGIERYASADQVRTQTGIGGIVIVLVSALSFSRAIQRMFERVWEVPHRGGIEGNRRCLLWLLSMVLYLQLLALASGLLAPDTLRELLSLMGQLALSTVAWWWSARMLLMSRVHWTRLLLGAVLTALGLSLLSRFSRLFMPAYVQANVEQFGGLGVLFAVSTWLLAFGCVLVVATVLGRVYTEELSVLRRWTAANPDRSRPPDRKTEGMPS